jgi:hypothetical protein
MFSIFMQLCEITTFGGKIAVYGFENIYYLDHYP